MQMDSLQSEDGQPFIRSLAQFIRQHEKALANSLQLSVHKRQNSANASATSLHNGKPGSPNSVSASASNHSSSLAAALSFAGLSFKSHYSKTALLTLTPHHLYYLLCCVEELGIAVGPMNVRLENVVHDTSPANYVSFLKTRNRPGKGKSDKDSLHSVSSVRSVMSSMTSWWTAIGLGGSSSSKSDKAKAAVQADLKYLYSALTKLPSLRLTSDHRARLIKGYEEFPFDTAVPLFAFKNLQQLDIVDVDFRQFCGWDRLAEQLVLLTVKRGHIESPAELLTDIVLDDAEKRRRRSTKGGRQGSPTPTSSWTVPSTPRADYAQSQSDPESPADGANFGHVRSESKVSMTGESLARSGQRRSVVDTTGAPQPVKIVGENTGLGISDTDAIQSGLTPPEPSMNVDTKITIATSGSPKRPGPSRPPNAYRHVRAYSTYSTKYKRSGSGSSSSEETYRRSESASNLTILDSLPVSKWQRLKYLSLSDNSMTSIPPHGFAPVASTLRSLNLSSNLFAEIPDSLAYLTRLVSLDLSNCMIESLQSLARAPLPAITTLKLKSNRLRSLAGVERLLSLESLDLRDNKLVDPTEAARLTNLPNLRRVWLKHNPFTRMYPEWRITVFNLFRKTPGYLEDILLDDSSPGYTERKHLVDRTPELESHFNEPTVRIADPAMVVHADERQSSVAEQTPTLSQTSGSRRKRPARRRIVDLAQENASARTRSEDAVLTRPSIEVKVPTKQEYDIMNPFIGPAVTSAKLDSMDVDPVRPVNDQPQDEYLRRIEQLRSEFGSNWLSHLGEQNWHKEHQMGLQQEQALAHPPLHRAHTTAIVSGGRTLG